MRDADNIKELLELKPDYLGLIFYAPSKRFVNETNFREQETIGKY